jgi:AAA family ATP:ADP antiporter
LVFTGRIHRRLGITFALRVLPVTMGFGTIALFLAAGFLPEMLVAAALILETGASGLRYSLDQSTRELLFLPVPSGLRVKAKAFIDVFIDNGAKGLAALLLLPVTFGLINPVQAGWISLVLIVIWLGVTTVVSREYVRAFRVGLKKRLVDSSVAVDLSDVTTLELLLESLGSSDRRQVLHCLDILAANGRADLVPPLLLYHDEPEVRLRTLGILADEGRVEVAPLIERRLGDPDPEVRAEAIRVLASMQGRDVCQLMLPKLEEGDPGVRAAAVACLANHGDEAMTADATRVLLDLLAEADPRMRVEAIKAVGAVREPLFQERLIQSLYDPDVGVVKEAVAAIRRRVARDGFNPLYVSTLISLLQNRRVKHEAREALVAFGEPAIPILVHFMNDSEEPLWVKRALPKAIAQVGTMAAAQALVEGLGRGSDSFLRRKQVEALNWMLEHGHRHALDREAVQKQVAEEARRFLQRVATLRGLGLHAKGDLEGPTIVWKEERVPMLLDRLLAERAANNSRNLFGLLALLYPPEHIWAAYRSLTSGDRMHRSHSLEFLDNTLEGELGRAVFAVIDDCPLGEKLARAAKVFGIRVRSRVETLRGLLQAHRAGEPDSAGIAAAALYEIRVENITGLEAEIEQLAAGAEDPFVAETAGWVAKRVARA